MNPVRVAILLTLFSSLAFASLSEARDPKSCRVNSDCVPAACCHASDVVNKKYGPKKCNVICTMECSGPLDCGMGYPACINHHCAIREKPEDPRPTE